MPPSPPYGVVWLLFVLAWVTNYLIRMALAALLPLVMADLALSYTAAGALTSVFFGAYAAMQFPAGLLGDRFGRRRVIVLGLLAGAAASAATALVASFAALLAVRLVTGAAQGCLFSNDRAIIAAVTPRDKIALGQGVSFAGPGLGLALGLVAAGMLGEVMPWRAVFLLFALPPLGAAALIARVVPETARAAAPEPLRARLGRVLGQRDLWLLGLSATAVMWVQYVVATWAPVLFVEGGVSELGRAGLYSGLLGLAGVAGLLAGGWLGDVGARSGLSRRTVLAASYLPMTLATMALAVAVQRGAPVGALAAALAVVACCAWGVWGPSFALLGEVFSGRDVSTAFGLYNAVCVLGAVVGPALTGWTRDVTGSFAAGCYVSAAVALAGGAVVLAVRTTPARVPG